MVGHKMQQIDQGSDAKREGYAKIQVGIGIQWHKSWLKLFLSIILRLISDNSIYESRDNITYAN